jgi:hypothetical protein
MDGDAVTTSVHQSRDWRSALSTGCVDVVVDLSRPDTRTLLAWNHIVPGRLVAGVAGDIDHACRAITIIENLVAEPAYGVADVRVEDDGAVVLVPVATVGPTVYRSERAAGNRFIRQVRAVAAGHHLDGFDPAVPTGHATVLDEYHVLRSTGCADQRTSRSRSTGSCRPQ